MCLGIPMQVISVDGLQANCQAADGEHVVDLSLVGPVTAGDWLMTFLGAAREKISAETARKSADAIEALRRTMSGEGSIDHLFADLIDREPQLPEHLRLQADAATKGRP